MHLPGTQGPSPYFVNYVKQQLIDRYGAGRVFGGGLKVKTTIDLRLQKLAHAAIDSTLTNPDGPTAALVAIDPRTGAVLTMIGGANYHKSQFNLAVQGERQPGSSFKPFVLATALSQGISPATMLTSKPQVISLGDKDWYVHNYEGAYLGPINLTTATVESDNTVYAQLTRIVGPANIVKTAHRLGITSPLQNYFAIGLGVEAVNPLEMARAYGAFANGGMRIDGRLTGNRPRGDRVGERRAEQPAAAARALAGDRRLPQPDPPGRRHLRHGAQGRAPRPAGRRQDRDDRELRRRVVRRLHAAARDRRVGRLPEPLRADAARVPRQGGRRRHVPGGDLEEVHDERAQAPGRPAGDVPGAAAPLPVAAPRRVPRQPDRARQRLLPDTSEIVYFGSAGPARRATCKKNEVEVPRVVGMTLAEAKARLVRQPLLASVVYKPAAPRQRVDIVVDQFPSTGGLSSWDKVTLVMAKPLHGVVPSVVGLDLRAARARLRKAKLGVRVGGLVDGKQGRVLAQAPLPGVAAAPGMAVVVQLGRG